MKKILLPIEIHIPAAIQAAAANISDAVRTQAETYASLLCAGLNIPAKIQVRIEPATDASDDWFVLQIGGQTARTRYFQCLPEQFLAMQPLGVGICEEICRNRTLLATAEVCAHAAAIAPESFRAFSAADQLRVVRALFHLGFGLDRLRQFPETGSDDASDPLRAVEYCIADLEACSAALYACASEITPDDDPNDYNRLVEALDLATATTFRKYGIPAPAVRAQLREDLEPGHHGFRFNDLYFPVRKHDTIVEQYQYLLELLQEFGFCFINRGSVQFLLESLETDNPNLLAVFRAKSDPDILVQVLRNFLQEKLPIRGLVRILEIMIAADDRYVVPPNTWFPTPISENIVFLGEDKPWSALTASDWSDFVRMYYKSGLRNQALQYIDSRSLNSVRSALALRNHHYFDRLRAAEGPEKASLLKTLHRQLADMLQDSLQNEEGLFCIDTIASYRRLLQDAVQMEFPEIAVFSNQEIQLVRLEAKGVYTLGLE